MIRLATVGTSAICEHFLNSVKLTERFSLSAVYSRDKSRGTAFAEKFGCTTVFTDLEEMAKSDIDAVYIASPNALHFKQSKLFLQYGKHVICEKPAVTSTAELDELIELSRKKGVVYTEAIIPIYTPFADVLKDEIKKLGTISTARIDFCQRSSRYDAFKRGERVNIFDMSLAAGALMDLGVYCVYAAVDLFGMPNRILSSADFLPNWADGSGSAIFNYPNFSAVISYSKTGQSALGSEIIGDCGSVKIKSISQYTGISSNIGGEEKQLVSSSVKEECMKWEAIYFADYIEHFNDFKDNYDHKTELMRNVHKCMEIMRNNNGIIFG